MGPPAEGQDKVRLTQGSAAWSMLGAGFGQNLVTTYSCIPLRRRHLPSDPCEPPRAKARRAGNRSHPTLSKSH